MINAIYETFRKKKNNISIKSKTFKHRGFNITLSTYRVRPRWGDTLPIHKWRPINPLLCKHWSLEQCYGQHQNIADVVLQIYWQVFHTHLSNKFEYETPHVEIPIFFKFEFNPYETLLLFLFYPSTKGFCVPIANTEGNEPI